MEIISIRMHLLNNVKEEDKYRDKGIKDKFSLLYFTSNMLCYVKHVHYACFNRIKVSVPGSTVYV